MSKGIHTYLAALGNQSKKAHYSAEVGLVTDALDRGLYRVNRT